MTDKKLSYKRKAKLLEESLNKEMERGAKMMGILMVTEHIFGTDLMKAIVAYTNDPTDDNHTAIETALAERVTSFTDTKEKAP